MPDTGFVNMSDSWLLDIGMPDLGFMEIEMEIISPSAPAFKNEKELVSRGRKGISRITEKKPWVTKFPFPRKSVIFWNMKIEDHQDAQYVADAVKSPEAVQFLNRVRKNPCQVPHFGASKCGNLVLEAANGELENYSTPAVDVEAANSELETYSTPAVDVEAANCELETYSISAVDVEECELWKPMIMLEACDVEECEFEVKEAAVLPLVKQYFRDDHDLDVSLPPSFSTEEDDKGSVVLRIFSIPSSASSFTIINSLVEAARSWRSQKKKALLLKLLPTEYDQFLYPSLKAGFTIHQVEATNMMLIQDLVAHVQPEQDVTIDQDLPHSIPEPGAVGTPEIKHVQHPVVADHPSPTDCLEEPGDEPDSESETMDNPTDEEVLSGESGASLESHTEIASADSHGPRTEPSRKRSAASAFYDNNLFAKIRSYVNQQIEQALLPLLSAFQNRKEDEHKHRQKMLAIEQEKLALMRQKLECTRRSSAVPASFAK